LHNQQAILPWLPRRSARVLGLHVNFGVKISIILKFILLVFLSVILALVPFCLLSTTLLVCLIIVTFVFITISVVIGFELRSIFILRVLGRRRICG
jgi:uncharacterized membrane protein